MHKKVYLYAYAVTKIFIIPYHMGIKFNSSSSRKSYEKIDKKKEEIKP